MFIYFNYLPVLSTRKLTPVLSQFRLIRKKLLTSCVTYAMFIILQNVVSLFINHPPSGGLCECCCSHLLHNFLICFITLSHTIYIRPIRLDCMANTLCLYYLNGLLVTGGKCPPFVHLMKCCK